MSWIVMIISSIVKYKTMVHVKKTEKKSWPKFLICFNIPILPMGNLFLGREMIEKIMEFFRPWP